MLGCDYEQLERRKQQYFTYNT